MARKKKSPVADVAEAAVDLTDLTRKQVRYFCFRIQTELAGGTAAPELPTGFKDHFESNKLFYGWDNFAKTWDIDATSELREVNGKLAHTHTKPLDVDVRGSSVWDEWGVELQKNSVMAELQRGNNKIIEGS